MASPLIRDLPREVRTSSGMVNFNEKLGEGSFGVVYSGSFKRSEEADSRPVAVKQIKDVAKQYLVEREGTILGLLKGAHHSNIVEFIEKVGKDREVYFIFELCDGNLQKFEPIQDVDVALTCMADLSAGVSCLHEMRIIHRDLKPENVLFKKVRENWCFKVGDFGLGREMETPSVSATRGVGTQSWMAPEALKKGASYASDVFSLGMIFLAVLLYRINGRLQAFQGTVFH